MLAVPTHRQIPATTCRRWVQGVLGQAGLAQNLPAAWSDLGRHGLCPLHTRFLICTQGKKMQPSKVTWLSSFPAECVSTWPDSSMHLELMKRSMSRSRKKCTLSKCFHGSILDMATALLSACVLGVPFEMTVVHGAVKVTATRYGERCTCRRDA